MRLARTSRLAVLVATAAIAAAGCASPAEAGWTFAPVPSATAAPSAGPSGAPSSGAPSSEAPASSGPAVSASPTVSSAPSAAPSGGSAQVAISASNVAFEQASVDAPAGTPFDLVFNNKDIGVQHDVWIKDATGNPVFQGAVVTGPAQTTYNVPALAAGSYTFVCSIHANMTGTMVVK